MLANEQVVDGRCERCGTEVELRQLTQWFLRITDYAQRLLDDMAELVDWPERVLTMQRNWIGRSEGARVVFRLRRRLGHEIPVFTTRPDTLFGATFFILAPEHPLVGPPGARAGPRRRRCASTRPRPRAPRRPTAATTDRPKTGVFTGRHVVNPVNGEAIPVWVADYVLMDYGTGAIMAVPAHDAARLRLRRRPTACRSRRVIAGEGDDAATPARGGLHRRRARWSTRASSTASSSTRGDRRRRGLAGARTASARPPSATACATG